MHRLSGASASVRLERDERKNKERKIKEEKYIRNRMY